MRLGCVNKTLLYISMKSGKKSKPLKLVLPLKPPPPIKHYLNFNFPENISSLFIPDFSN